MKHVLVYGYNGTVFGGVEKVQLEYIKAITQQNKDITFDILVSGENCNQESLFLDMGCRVLYIPVRRKNIQGYKTCMNKIFSETQYDAVWCNVSGLTNIDVLVMAKKKKVPTRIIHAHTSHLMWGNLFMRFLVPLMHYWNKLRLSRFATHYWACSQQAGRFMFPSSVQDQVYVVKNAIDTSLFHPDAIARNTLRDNLEIHDLAVVHTARLSKEKNQKFLLYVMQKIVEQVPKAKLFLIGEGDLRMELEELASQLNLQENVIFAGFQSNIYEWLCAADVFLLPSLAEGLGLSAIEAQACGLPCVLSSTVPSEADITGAVRFVPLIDTAEHWAHVVIEMAQATIADPLSSVKKSGYEISSCAKTVYNILKGE